MSQQSSIKLIVGLGNPGAQYEHTRHNAGAWFIQMVAHCLQVSLRYAPKLQGFHTLAKLDHEDCHLLIPSTYMNHSGQSVQAAANYYKIAADSILIAHDEIDLVPGDTRLKWDGGDGGHNGLKDVIRHLNTKQFLRLRIGVGRPIHSDLVHDYVLTSPKKTEHQEIMRSLDEAYTILPLLVAGQVQKAMLKLHTKKT